MDRFHPQLKILYYMFSYSDISSAQSQCIYKTELRPEVWLTGGRRLTPASTAPLPALGEPHSPAFCCFTYITAHSPTLLLLHLHHSSFCNPSSASPTSQLILQPFCCFTYITAHSPTLLLLHLHHSSFCNPSSA